MLRVATDIGGTFTDVAFYDVDPTTGEAGAIQTFKADTLPADLSEGVLRAIAGAGLDLADIAFLAHGSTVVINALTERKGVRTGLITTHGFRDVLEIARGNRPDLYNFRFRKPEPFVPRHLRLEVDERIGPGGEVIRPPRSRLPRCRPGDASRQGCRGDRAVFSSRLRQPGSRARRRRLCARTMAGSLRDRVP